MEVSQPTAPTEGWDTVFALDIEEINRAISDAGAVPAQFQYTNDDGSETVEGSFSNWVIAPGGSGKDVCLMLNVSKGSLAINDPEDGIQTKIPFEDLQVDIEVNLDFIESKTQPSTGRNLDLKIGKSSEKPISVTGVRLAGASASFELEAEGPAIFEEWLNKNLAIFDKILATITLNNELDKGDFTWLAPTSVAYAYSQKTNPDDNSYLHGSGLLSVLCMTERRSSDGLTSQVSENAIPPGQKAAFLIGKNRILEKLVLPNVCKGFKGLSTDDFEFASDGDSVELKPNSSIPFTARAQDGKSYDGNIQMLSVTVFNDCLRFQSESSTDLGAGVTAHTRSTHSYRLYLKNTSGGQTIAYEEVGKPDVTHWTTKDGVATFIEVFEAVLGAIVSVVIAVVSAGTAMVVGLVLAGLIYGLLANLPNLVGLIGGDDAPDIGGFVATVTAPIAWTGGRTFNLTDVTLSESLRFTGTYK